jgi:phosphoglycolate phosphatase-like HAD superfamily hydrolase
VDLLEARDVTDGWTTSADVEQTKPEPDLVGVAVEKAGGGEAVMVGDSTWDCEAARRAEVPTVAVLTGGFSEQELRDAGALQVFESIAALRASIGETPLG